MPMNTSARLCFVATFVLLLASCQYRWGSPFPHGETIALDGVVNQTREASLTPALTGALNDALLTSPGLKLTGADDADYLLRVTLKAIEQSRLASTYQRDKKDTNNDYSGYQSVLFRITLTSEYQLFRADNLVTPVKSGSVTALADLPRMQDMEIGMKPALKQAAQDTARRILDEVTDHAPHAAPTQDH